MYHTRTTTLFFRPLKIQTTPGPEFGCDDDPSGVCDLDQGAGPYVVFQGSGRSYEGRLPILGAFLNQKPLGHRGLSVAIPKPTQFFP